MGRKSTPNNPSQHPGLENYVLHTQEALLPLRTRYRRTRIIGTGRVIRWPYATLLLHGRSIQFPGKFYSQPTQFDCPCISNAAMIFFRCTNHQSRFDHLCRQWPVFFSVSQPLSGGGGVRPGINLAPARDEDALLPQRMAFFTVCVAVYS